METADLHLGPSKGPAGAKSRPKWSAENRDESQHPVPKDNKEEMKEDPSVREVWTPAEDFK